MCDEQTLRAIRNNQSGDTQMQTTLFDEEPAEAISSGKVFSGWQRLFEAEMSKPYFEALKTRLAADTSTYNDVLPTEEDRFRAFQFFDPADTRIVILGQDPYHGEGQAMGLSFSVREGVKIPPSLRNIFKELAEDRDQKPKSHGDLTGWAQQGVLLLNSALTVRLGKAGSHSRIGWHQFTDRIIETLGQGHVPTVFMLWGKHAEQKASLIAEHHLCLTAPHPSPLSAHRGFFGCHHFSKANDFLKAHERLPVQW